MASREARDCLFLQHQEIDGHYTHCADGEAEALGRELALLTFPSCSEAEARFQRRPIEPHPRR